MATLARLYNEESLVQAAKDHKLPTIARLHYDMCIVTSVLEKTSVLYTVYSDVNKKKLLGTFVLPSMIG